MKVLILGHTQSGKSLAAKMVAEILNSPAPASSTSKYIIRDYAKSVGKQPEEIAQNKDEYRQQLFQYGKKIQAKDPAYPVSEALKETDVVAGVRTAEQLKAVAPLFDKILWIHRDVPKGKTDINIEDAKEASAEIINNTGSIDDLKVRLIAAFQN